MKQNVQVHEVACHGERAAEQVKLCQRKQIVCHFILVKEKRETETMPSIKCNGQPIRKGTIGSFGECFDSQQVEDNCWW